MIGTRLEHYEITAHLGSGGMGQVYQATDSKLGRSVAIKILPEAFSQDSDRVARFEREARVLASLNHPHIAAIYGLERSAERTFLVMELVPGETLAERIARNRARPGLPMHDAVSLAHQIAEALQAAHQTGIIHRDLKPANIKITPDGEVKVLDFGLAKTSGSGDKGADLSQSPTITNAAMTEAGVILGTAAYMSPEQAKGHTLDKRTDLWSFGCILYEMLTGARLFEANDVSDTLAAVLMREPDWSRLPANLPPSVHRLLRRCLERDRAKRLSDISGALFALDEPFDVPSAAAPLPTRHAAAGWIVAVLILVVAVISLVLLRPGAPADQRTMHLQIETRGGDPFTFALSPDGRSIVFQATVDGKTQLWLRDFDTGEDQALAGTDGGIFPFWSPDSLSVAFFVNDVLKRVDLASGFVRTLTMVPGDPRPGTWNRDGIVLFSMSIGPLYKVSAEGGTAMEQVTTLLPGQSSHRFSQFLPDGRRFLMQTLGESDVKGLYLGSLDSKDTVRLMDGEPAFSFLAPNHLLVARHGGLWAQELDLDSGKLRGELLPVAPRIFVDAQINGLVALSTSLSGSMAYRPAPETRQLLWLDRDGQQTGTLGEPDDSQSLITGSSADGRTISLRRVVDGNTDVWLMDAVRGALRRLTLSPAIDASATISPDGSRIVYASDPKSTLWDVYERNTDGTGGEKVLVATPENENPTDYSPDGRYILFDTEKNSGDVMALPMFGDGKPIPVAQTSFVEYGAKFSPDGKWVAFLSNESGRGFEIYVQPFPGPGAKAQISIGGAVRVKWPRGGKELFYITPTKVMAVTWTQQGITFVPDPPRHLFNQQPGDNYEVSPDGQRFLVNRVASPPPPISIIVNWKPPKR